MRFFIPVGSLAVKPGVRGQNLSTFALLCLLMLCVPPFVSAQRAELVSVKQDGTASGNGLSITSSGNISADGRFVAFTSQAGNLTGQDTNGTYDAFVRDRKTGTTTLASVNASGTGAGNGGSGISGNIDFPATSVALSADGRFVAFTSAASDLVANDTNAKEDVFVRDLEAGRTWLVSVNAEGTASGNGSSAFPYLSADGSMVGFRSVAGNLVPNDTNNTTDVFVRNLKTGATTLVSVNSAGTASGNGTSNFATFSADGQVIAFLSRAGDLVANDSNGTLRDDVFVRNLQTGITTLVSASFDGLGSGNNHSNIPLISADGHTVVFNSRATNLVTQQDVNGTDDVFVRNLATGTTTLVSVNLNGKATGSRLSYVPSPAAISANGNIIAFVSNSPDLVSDDTNGTITDVFVRDVAAGTTKLVSANSAGNGSGNSFSAVYEVSVNASGRFVIFDSLASDLVAGINSGLEQNVFVRDIQQSKTILASPRASGATGGNKGSSAVTLSADGSVAIFISDATDLVANDTNGLLDVFAFSVPQPGSIGFSATTYGTVEGQAVASVNVTRTGGSSGAVSATFTTSDGTATNGQDYSAVNQTITFADGDAASKTITIPINDDALVEGAESVNLSLGNPTGGAILGITANAVLTIADNDTCSYAINPTSRTSPAAGETTSVNVATQAGCSWTAVSNGNFVSVTSGASGTGNGVVTLNVLSNGSGVPRSGTVSIAGQTFTITQPESVPQVPTFQFGAASYSVGEGDARVTITVTRTGGSASSAATVDYRTVDSDTFAFSCADTTNNHGGAFARCDFSTSVGRLDFAAGDTQQTINVPIIDDGHVEGAETFQLFLTNPTGVAVLGTPATTTVTIQDDDAPGASNPIFETPFFVRQHYLDFLSREPEAREPWSQVLNKCPNPFNRDPHDVSAACDRLIVSQSFFGSPEFRLKGFYVFRFYKLAFNRLPEYTEIVTDMSFVAGATAEEVFARKAQLATAFIARPDFIRDYGGLNNSQYVVTLMGRYGLSSVTTPDPSTPDGETRVTLTQGDLVSRLETNALTRAQVFRAIADSDEAGAREFDNAFVAMQYYGYLRRTPEAAGYEAWLAALRRGDIRAMVDGFMNSAEYKLRFGRL